MALSDVLHGGMLGSGTIIDVAEVKLLECAQYMQSLCCAGMVLRGRGRLQSLQGTVC